MADEPAPTKPKEAGRFSRHVARYGMAYLTGLIFFVVTNATAYVEVFGEMKPEQMATMTPVQWHVAYASMMMQAGTVLLAFINKTFATAQQP